MTHETWIVVASVIMHVIGMVVTESPNKKIRKTTVSFDSMVVQRGLDHPADA